MAGSGNVDSTAETVAGSTDVAQPAALEFILGFARTGHEAGYATAELEERVVALADALGLQGVEISATPTLVEISVGSIPHQRSYALRVRPTAVDLDAVSRLDDLVRLVLDTPLGPEAALAELEQHGASHIHRPWPVLLAAYATAGAALTPILGGAWREALAAALVGLAVGAIALPAQRNAAAEPLIAPVAAVAASFGAATLAQLGLEISADVVTLAALVTFLPGMRLTIGMRELATEHLQSGVANTASALVQLLGLVFGVAIGRSVATSWFGKVPDSIVASGFSGVELVAAVAAGLAFTLTLRARYRDALIMCAATVLALSATELGTTVFGRGAAVFVAALAVGVAGGLLGAWRRRSPLVFIVPGILILVPGSTGFNSVLQLLTDQTVSGITAGFDTFVTAMSIAYGLMVSALVLPRRFTQLTARRQGG